MALTKCEECGRDVSTKAASCPGCGAPVEAMAQASVQSVPPKKKGIGIGKAILVVVAALVGLNLLAGDEEGDASVVEAARATEQPSAVAAVPAKPSGPDALRALRPDAQSAFLAIVAEQKAAYLAADTDMMASRIRRNRGTQICDRVGRSFEGWVGYATQITTTGDGLGVLKVELEKDVEVGTTNNGFSNAFTDTLIPQGSLVFAALERLKPGAPVRVSGTVLESADHDCWLESSLTEKGSMTSPWFEARISAVEPIDGVKAQRGGF